MKRSHVVTVSRLVIGDHVILMKTGKKVYNINKKTKKDYQTMPGAARNKTSMRLIF